jgi:hypothetical protein
MKFLCLSIAILFAGLLPHAQAQAQAQDAPSVSPPPTAYSREKAQDTCTTAPQTEWLPADEMQLLARHRGYRIKTFKIANGSCYEVYGFDRNGQIVEAYFDPVTTRLVRQNIAR